MTRDAAAFIYARTDSRRLPGKIFLEFGGCKVIDIVHARAARLDVSQVVVLTTDRGVDDPLAEHCAQRGYSCFRGHPTDLVRRTLQAIDVPMLLLSFVRVNGDCPLFEPTLANAALRHIRDGNSEAARTRHGQQHYHAQLSLRRIGRVRTCSGLCQSCGGSSVPKEREHVTQHLYRLSDRLSLHSMRDTGGNHSQRRLTVGHAGGRADAGASLRRSRHEGRPRTGKCWVSPPLSHRSALAIDGISIVNLHRGHSNRNRITPEKPRRVRVSSTWHFPLSRVSCRVWLSKRNALRSLSARFLEARLQRSKRPFYRGEPYILPKTWSRATVSEPQIFAL